MQNYYKLLFFVPIVFSSLMFSSCDKGVTVPTNIKIMANDVAFKDVESKFAVEVTPTDAKNDVTYKVSDSSVATIDENGIFKGLKEGTVTVTATSKYKSEVNDSIDVYVVDANFITEKEFYESYETGYNKLIPILKEKIKVNATCDEDDFIEGKSISEFPTSIIV